MLRLSLAEYKTHADAVEEGLHRVAQLLDRECIYDAAYVPYASQLIPLAAVAAHLGAAFLEEPARSKILRWYWCGVFGELCGGATEFDLNKLDAEARGFLVATVAKKLHARRLFPPEKHELFISAVNTLVRHYMVELEDPFAEEVVLHHLASMWTGGVLQVLQCDGDLLDSTHYAGKIPPVMRRPWVIHPPERVERTFSALLGIRR